jgi:hypothetical protein
VEKGKTRHEDIARVSSPMEEVKEMTERQRGRGGGREGGREGRREGGRGADLGRGGQGGRGRSLLHKGWAPHF